MAEVTFVQLLNSKLTPKYLELNVSSNFMRRVTDDLCYIPTLVIAQKIQLNFTVMSSI